jgi:hypothetical protein
MSRYFTFLAAVFTLATANFADSAPAGENLETLVQKILPDQIKSLTLGKTTRAETEKTLGAPQKNGITVGFNAQNKLRYFYYKLPYSASEQKYVLSSFEPLIPIEDLKAAKKKFEAEASRPDAGRTFDIAIPKKGLLLKFNLSEPPTLNAVLSWKPGEKMP